jgi:BirA family transcriptional regulator, biotin operon repressor / biotin---[acetyl-CoA-carboxylase] ligase
MSDGVIGRPLIRLDAVSSTMDVARILLANGAQVGTTVLAGYQSAGRGRSSRQWETQPGAAILTSFITASRRPVTDLGVLSLLWGWAVASTVESFTERSVTIKWPNDVLVDGRKIAGILTTNVIVPGGHHQITGIGLNVTAGEVDLPPTGTSLAMVCNECPALDDVFMVLVNNLDQALALADDTATDHLPMHVQPRLAMLNETITVQDADRSVVGRLRGVDASGALQLILADGEIVRIVAGDLTRGPRRHG